MTTVLTRMVARLLLAPALMVAVAVLVKGYADVGDGFAGGVIAALGVLCSTWPSAGRRSSGAAGASAPAAAVTGLLLALAVAFVPCCAGSAPLQPRAAHGRRGRQLGTLELITAVAFDVGVFLLVLGHGRSAPSSSWPARSPPRGSAVNLVFALAVAVLFGSGAYLLLKPTWSGWSSGWSLISNAASVTCIGGRAAPGAGADPARRPG